MKSSIDAGILFAEDQLTECRLKELLSVITGDDLFHITKWGLYEPLRSNFNKEHIPQIANSIVNHVMPCFLFEISHGNSGALLLDSGSSDSMSVLSIRLQATADNAKKCERWLSKLSLVLNSFYSYAHITTKSDLSRGLRSGAISILDPENQSYLLFVTKRILNRCIPDVYAMQYFGKELKERFNLFPVTEEDSNCEHIAGGGLWLKLTDNVFEFSATERVAREVQNEYVSKLGAEKFCAD